MRLDRKREIHMTGFVDFDVNFSEEGFTREQVEMLLREMFRERTGVQSVKLTELAGAHMGLSGISIFLAQPYGVHRIEQNPLVIRIGPNAVIDAEQQRYRDYVASLTGLGAVQQRLYASADRFSAIAYDYLDQQPGQPMKTLRDFLWDEEQRDDLEAACQAITDLFRNTLAQQQRRNNWYHDGRAYDDQRPLWFYNTLLPPALKLQVDDAISGQAPTHSLAELLALADQPGAAALLGQQVELRTDEYPHLRVVERKQHDTRLYLYEGALLGAEPYQPPQPIAARIDLVGSPEALDLPDDLDKATLRGRIVATRYTALEARRLQCVAHLSRQTADGRLPGQGGLLDNPIARLNELLAKRRTFTSAIAHGDMNLGNILLNRSAAGSAVTAWLIDFDKTGPGQHAVFDAVKLETEYKAHLLPYLVRNVDDQIELETILHQALIEPDKVVWSLKERPHLRDAYQFIATVRRVALQDLKQTIAPEEYYLGLLGYGLAVLKYDNLYAGNRGRWLQQYPPIDPLALAAFVSASHAATVVDECADLVVKDECYPPIRQLTRAPIKRPRLVGRDELLVKAQLQLRSETPVVLLHGASGSGRGAVAQALCADLDRRGYLVCTLLADTSEHEFETIDGLLRVLSPALRSAGISDIDVPPRPASTSKARQWTREEHLEQMSVQLYSLINSLEHNKQPVVLLLWLTRANAELRSLISRIVQQVRQTALVIVAEQPFRELDARIQIQVNRLTDEDVATYVRLKQLSLEAETVGKLHQASEGRPDLLERILFDAQIELDRQKGSLNQIVDQLASRKNYLAEAAKDLLDRQPESIRHLCALECLVSTQASTSMSEATLTDSERRTIIEGAGWAESGSAGELLDRYKEQRLDTQDTVIKHLREHALRVVEVGLEYRKLRGLLARVYRSRDPQDLYLIAHNYMRAAEWREVATILAQMVNNPEYIFSAHCSNINDWLQQVFKQQRVLYIQYERALRELSGMCDMYLGKHQTAIATYSHLCRNVRFDDPAYPLLVVRLLQVAAVYGDRKQAAYACGLLARRPRVDAWLACKLAYEGEQLLKPAIEQSAAPEQAIALFEEALVLLEQHDTQWGDEVDFFREQRVRVYDKLARAQMLQGQTAVAIEQLLKAREEALALENMPLLASLESSLGYIYYYRCGRDDDPEQARTWFEQALRTREEIGDRAGQVRTAQNLGNLLVDLAPDRVAWQSANEFFRQYESVAREIQDANHELIIANYIDSLIDQGEHSVAHTLFESVMVEPVRDPDTELILLTNRAKLALWEEARPEQREECQHYLLQAYPLVRNSEDDSDKLEWMHIVLGSHILLGTELHESVHPWLEEILLSEEDRQPERALWFLDRGLFALAQQDHAQALAHLAESRAIWERLKFPFRAGLVAYWQALCRSQMDDRSSAQMSAEEAESLLRSFGDTPVRRRLHQL
jgi:hypothetical protein